VAWHRRAPATIIDRSTYDDPHQYPAGIGTVIVNGTVVIDGGEHTGAHQVVVGDLDVGSWIIGRVANHYLCGHTLHRYSEGMRLCLRFFGFF
jgi:hypothetical protein